MILTVTLAFPHSICKVLVSFFLAMGIKSRERVILDNDGTYHHVVMAYHQFHHLTCNPQI